MHHRPLQPFLPRGRSRWVCSWQGLGVGVGVGGSLAPTTGSRAAEWPRPWPWSQPDLCREHRFIPGSLSFCVCKMGTVPSRKCSAWNRPVWKHLQTYGVVVGLHPSDLRPSHSQDRASRCWSGQRGQEGLVPGGDTGSESQTTTRKPIAGRRLCAEKGLGLRQEAKSRRCGGPRPGEGVR